MLGLFIVSCIAIIICVIGKKKRSNLKNNETRNTNFDPVNRTLPIDTKGFF